MGSGLSCCSPLHAVENVNVTASHPPLQSWPAAPHSEPLLVRPKGKCTKRRLSAMLARGGGKTSETTTPRALRGSVFEAPLQRLKEARKAAESSGAVTTPKKNRSWCGRSSIALSEPCEQLSTSTKVSFQRETEKHDSTPAAEEPTRERPRRQVRFSTNEASIHEFYPLRPTNTHLSDEKPLLLPPAPPCSFQSAALSINSLGSDESGSSDDWMRGSSPAASLAARALLWPRSLSMLRLHQLTIVLNAFLQKGQIRS